MSAPKRLDESTTRLVKAHADNGVAVAQARRFKDLRELFFRRAQPLFHDAVERRVPLLAYTSPRAVGEHAVQVKVVAIPTASLPQTRDGLSQRYKILLFFLSAG